MLRSSAGMHAAHSGRSNTSASRKAVSVRAVPPQQTNTSTSSSNSSSSKSGVVIVGGGPAGFASAMMLAKRGWTDISILESADKIGHEDITKSFVYGIDGRGQRFLDHVGLKDLLPKYGVALQSACVAKSLTNGKVTRATIPMKDDSKLIYFMPRPKFMDLLYEGLEPLLDGPVDLHLNTKCTGLRQTDDGQIEVTAASSSGETITFQPRLVIGADGLHSKVRQTLHQLDPSGRFEMQKVDSASAGLRYKVMMLPANPKANHDGDECLENEALGVYVGALTGSSRAARLGLLPVRDPTAMRPANLIVKEPHEFFDATTGEQLYEYLEKNFPQMPVRELIPPDRAQLYAEASGGRFPNPQRTDDFYMLFGGSQGRQSEEASSTRSTAAQDSEASAMLLVGDSCHCFPPDLGQGVNSALEDVLQFGSKLDKYANSLESALPEYQEERSPNIKALIRLQQFGYPTQYGQDKAAQFLWMCNLALRALLNRMFPQVFDQVAFIMLQDPTLSYSEIVNRANTTTSRIQILSTALGMAFTAKLAWGVTLVPY